MEQLELYKNMGCPRDIKNHPQYQRWLFQREVDLAVAAGMAPDRVRFEDEEVQQEGEVRDREVELRCRKCRYVYSYSYPLNHLFLLITCIENILSFQVGGIYFPRTIHSFIQLSHLFYSCIEQKMKLTLPSPPTVEH